MATQVTRQQISGPTITGVPLPNWAAYAGILPRGLLKAKKDFFMYTADFLTLAASANQQGVATQIQADSAFLIIGASAIVTDSTNATFIANVPETVQINDSGSGRNLFGGFVHFNVVFGTALNPFYWPYPKLIKAASTLTTILNNLEATARNVRIVYYGFKVFGFSEDS